MDSRDGSQALQICYHGHCHVVAYAVDKNGKMPAKDFLESVLDKREAAKMVSRLKRLADHGRINNDEQFKKERNDIFALKIHQRRLYCFIENGVWYLTNGTEKKKKQNRANPQDLDRAERIRNEYLKR